MTKLKKISYTVAIVVSICILIVLSLKFTPKDKEDILIISGAPNLSPYTIDSIISSMAYGRYTNAAVTFSNIKNNTIFPNELNNIAKLMLNSNTLAKNIFSSVSISVDKSTEDPETTLAIFSAEIKKSLDYNKFPIVKTNSDLYNTLVDNFKNNVFELYIEIDENHTITKDINLMLKSAANDAIFWQNPTNLHISQIFPKLLYVNVEFDTTLKDILTNKHLVLSMKNLIAESCGITENMTELEKIEKIHKRVIELISYNDALALAINKNSLTPEDRINNSAYGAIIQNSTACMGYSQAIKLLCEHFGIECYTVTGTINGIGHMWNIVKCEGEYFYIDATFSDTSQNTLPIFFSKLMRGSDIYIPSLDMFCPVEYPGVKLVPDNSTQDASTQQKIAKIFHTMW